jgi:hypothetical protein
VTFADNIAALIAPSFPDHAEQIAAWWDRWPEMFSGTIPETVAVIERPGRAGRAAVRPDQHVQRELARRAGDEPGLPPFPRRDRLGRGAGDQARTAHLRDRAGAHGPEPVDLLFVDDSAANIAAADAMGFHTHHFTDPAGLRAAVEMHGLL